MKIYLAGKIGKNDWRHDLVPGLRDAYHDYDFSDCTYWTPTPMEYPNLIYVGPFFVSCDHGCAHSEGHGWIGGGCISEGHGPMGLDWPSWTVNSSGRPAPTRLGTAGLCRDAIKQCDVLFAWLGKGRNGYGDADTAYGTLVEIGWATAAGKKIVLAAETHNPDFWLAYQCAEKIITAPDPVGAFEVFVRTLEDDNQAAKCESPLEQAFWEAYQCSRPTELAGLVVQHPVSANGHNYRLDFAIPDRKIAFEMDGYTYHGKSSEAFNRDRRRDLNLKLAGWHVHRFDGDMIRSNSTEVVNIAAKLAVQGK